MNKLEERSIEIIHFEWQNGKIIKWGKVQRIEEHDKMCGNKNNWVPEERREKYKTNIWGGGEGWKLLNFMKSINLYVQEDQLRDLQLDLA